MVINGKRDTATIAGPAYPEDEGSTSFGLIRQNTKVAIGEYVEVKKAE